MAEAHKPSCTEVEVRSNGVVTSVVIHWDDTEGFLQFPDKKSPTVYFKDIIYVVKEDECAICCYVFQTKSNLLQRKKFQLVNVSKDIVRRLQEASKKTKLRSPQKMILYVNPFSGSERGRKVGILAEEIFTQHGVEVTRIVSGEPLRIEDAVSKLDLAAFDSAVCVGGDGTYSEFVNALFRRHHEQTQYSEKENHDVLPLLPLPIGVIPAGTQNGVALSMFGTSDIENCALRIMQGNIKRVNVLGVYSGQGQLITYSMVCLGFSLLGECSRTAESNRQMGRARYLWGMVKAMVQNKRYGMDIKYLPHEKDQNPAEGGYFQRLPDKSKDEEKDWLYFQGEMMSFLIISVDQMFPRNPAQDSVVVPAYGTLWMENSRWKFVKVLAKFARYVKEPEKINEQLSSLTGRVAHFLEMHVRATGRYAESGERLPLNHDGDVLLLEQPEFRLRVHPGALELYCL